MDYITPVNEIDELVFVSRSDIRRYILSEYISETGYDSSSHDLASFNLNLGDFGQARLVASLNVGSGASESVIKVTLSRGEPSEEQSENITSQDKISIECCMIIINEEGKLENQVHVLY